MSSPLHRLVIATALLGTLAAPSTDAQEGVVVDPERPPRLVVDDSEVRTLRGANGVAYKLYVRVPRRAAEHPANRFDVVYLLDADYSFLLARNISEHLADRDHLADLILVGVAYDGPLAYRENRTRDYTPLFWATGGYGPEYQKISGGGPAFLTFLEKELFPFVEKTYPATAGRTLVGHSYGGLFASWVLVTRPELFARYVVVSPSLWYADERMFALDAKAAETRTDLPVRAYFAVGEREVDGTWNMPDLMVRFVAQLRAHAYPGLALESRVWPDETHNSIFAPALSSGLRFVHQGR